MCGAKFQCRNSSDSTRCQSDAVRNEWAHCNFADWDEFRYLDAFQKMEALVRSLGLPKNDTDGIVDELNDWMGKGTYYFERCFLLL